MDVTYSHFGHEKLPHVPRDHIVKILTCGEDGIVKIWSKSGLLRTTLASLGQAIYAVAWSPDGTNVVMSQATKIQTKSIQPSARSEIWNAHSALITGKTCNNFQK